ncbi:hypothetical protein KEM56_004794, partial [Ascosphaera pollenicola]
GFLTLYLLAPIPRKPLHTETQYTTIADDDAGSITPPSPLPCWLDSLRRGAAPVAIEDAEVFMSVVVPAYNEEERIRGMLDEAVAYLETNYEDDEDEDDDEEEGGGGESGLTRRKNASRSEEQEKSGWEIIIVSDGSTDRTVETALAFARDYQTSRRRRQSRQRRRQPFAGSIRVVSLEKNRGKGGAVTHGMRHVRGQYVLFADADGASDFHDLSKLLEACRLVEDAFGRGVAVGSRAHLVGSEAVVKRSKLRNFLMHSFHLFLRLLTPPATAAVKDTQCGFKLFSRTALPYIVPFMHSEGWIFDVEMLMLAESARIAVAEVPVGWHEVRG